MVNRDKVEYRDSTPFNQDKLQDLQTIKHFLLHAVRGKDVRAPIAQMPDAIIKWIKDADNLGQLGALLEIIEARGGFETLGIHESAQDNDINNNKDDIENTKQMIESLIDAVRKLNSNDPHGVFPNLDALKAKYPNGDKGIYITQDNGHWWFYNNGWVDGGVWQASKFDFSGVDLNGINLLHGTSDVAQTIFADGWGFFTTANNFQELNLQKGQDYIYSVVYKNLPSAHLRMNVAALQDDGTIAWQDFAEIDQNGKTVLRINIPTNVSYTHVRVCAIFASEQGTKQSVSIAEESLTKGSMAYKHTPNPDDVAPGRGIQIVNEVIEYNKLLDLIHTYGSAINLMNGTKSEVFAYTSTGYGSLSQAQFGGYRFYNFVRGATYTYSLHIDTLPTVPMHLAVLGLKGNNIVWSKYSDPITKTGRPAITFSIPNDDIDMVKLSLSTLDNQTANFTVIFGAEKLSFANKDSGYSKSYNDMTAQQLSDNIYKTLYKGDDPRLIKTVPFVNLLAGTSNVIQTIKASGWGEVSTATNSKKFDGFIKGETYCYRATFGKLPDNKVTLEAKGVNSSGKNAWVFHQYVTEPGDTALVFEVPNDDVAYIQFSVVFPENIKDTVDLVMGKEKLSICGYDNGYSDAPNSSYEARTEALDFVADSVKENHFQNMHLPVINIGGRNENLYYIDSDEIFPFDFYHDGKKQSLYGSFAWQGDSSKMWDEKNFKMKTFQDTAGNDKFKWRPLPTFYKSHHFTLKAYYTDRYLIRDLVAAEIYSWFVANNPTAPKELLLANHFGAVQGTPVMVYFRGNFYGVFQLNTKSSSDLWNMDKNDPNQIALQGQINNAACQWEATPTYGTDFELESDNETNAASALKKLSDALVGVDDATFKANINKMFDVNSIADYYIFNRLINNTDCWGGKNVNYLTYDNGEHWFLMSYDFNTSMLQDWKPGMTSAPDRMISISNTLIKRFVALFDVEIKARYAQLQSLGILNVAEYCRELDKRANEIGYDAYQMDEQRWPENESYAEKEHLEDIKYMFVLRKQMMDKLLK